MAPRDMDLELHRALESDNVKAVRELLSRKADPNSPSAKGQTPLEIAAEGESLLLAKVLLVYQADPESLAAREDLPTTSEASALVRSWGQCDLSTVFGGLEDCVIESSSSHDVSLLGLALASIDIVGGDAEQICKLKDEKQNSLLHLCSLNAGNSADATAEAAARLTARTLLGWGVPVNGRNKNNETALYLALQGMHAKLRGRVAGSPALVPAEPARALLEARADAEELDPHTRESLLMQAAKVGDLTACRLLLDHNADPLRQNPQGQNAIQLSSARPEVAMLLRHSILGRNGAQAALAEEAEAQAAVKREDSLASALVKETSMSSEPEFIKIGDQDACSVEGLLNQVDLEDSYDQDWGNPQICSMETSLEQEWDSTPAIIHA